MIRGCRCSEWSDAGIWQYQSIYPADYNRALVKDLVMAMFHSYRNHSHKSLIVDLIDMTKDAGY
jgi:hypothetical protein